MGNSESAFQAYRYHFDDPIIGDLDLSQMKVYKIDDEMSAEAAKTLLRSERTLYVDCEGRYFGGQQQRLGTVQICTDSDRCLVFHITKYRQSLDFLKGLFESDSVRKVFHDCSGDSAVLFHENGIRLTNTSVDDIQIAHKVIESMKHGKPIDVTTGPSLANLYKFHCGKNIPGNKRFNKNRSAVQDGNMWIDNPELTDRMIKYAVVDVIAIREIFTTQKRILRRTSEYKDLIQQQLQTKIKHSTVREQTAQQQLPKSFNWGLLAAGVGAVAAVALAAAASSGDKTKNEREDDEQKKKEECIIS